MPPSVIFDDDGTRLGFDADEQEAIASVLADMNDDTAAGQNDTEIWDDDLAAEAAVREAYASLDGVTWKKEELVPVKLEHNAQIDEALAALLVRRGHVFITGSAGTGKSTLLRYFLQNCGDQQTVVLAPTGVAALNVGGETIHHFMRIGPMATRGDVFSAARRLVRAHETKLYESVDALIIDEISMVRADLFDFLDLFLRLVRGNERPFGGVRLICFGDLYQLPPVVKGDEREAFEEEYETPFFFSSQVFDRLQRDRRVPLEYIQLQKIYRQTDERFISLLQEIRTQSITPERLALLNERVLDDGRVDDLAGDFVVLTATKARAEAINNYHLECLPGRVRAYLANQDGKFPDSSRPTLERLRLKKGARVMLLNNHPKGAWVNGTMGEIEAMYRDFVLVKLDGGETVKVDVYTWENYHAVFNPVKQTIEREKVGEFSQLPLKLAWAVTIHKAQGQTFERLAIDLGRGAFAGGQTYVALSRGTSLEGICLARPLRPEDICCDQHILRFYQELENLEYFGESTYGRFTNKPKRKKSQQGVQETIL